MSQARVHTVARAQVRKEKDGTVKPNNTCQTCEIEIKPGDPYRWFIVGFRSSYKQIRCTKPECTPTRAQLESSKMSAIYDAVDSADFAAAGSVDDLQQVLSEVADVFQEIADEYREASVNPNTGAVFSPDSEERADTLDAACSDLQSWSPSGDDHCAKHEEFDDTCDDCDEELQNLRSEAQDVLNDVEAY